MSPKKRKLAPEFMLQDTKGEKISLDSLIIDQKLLLLFFPLAFSSVCTEELCKVRDDMKLYNSFKTKVAAISVDSFFTLKKFKQTENLNFTLLSDFNKQVSRQYEVLYEDYFGMKGVSKRAVFVIDTDRSILHKEILQDSGKLPDFKAIQSTIGG